MKPTLLTFLLVFLVNLTNGQSSDSIKISRHDVRVLIGTTVLKSSEKNMTALYAHGLILDQIKSSDCMQTEHEGPTGSKIVKIEVLDDSLLTIEALIDANCSYNFLGEIDVVDDSIINLDYHGYGGYAQCNCCFGLTYTIRTSKNWDFKPEKVKYVMISSLRQTKKRIQWMKK